MTDTVARPLTVRIFMTHDMADEDIEALSTGREAEFRRIMAAIGRSRAASPGVLQHVVMYGARGFGKSFMTRRVQIAVARLVDGAGPVIYLLLPEEQHNLQRSPQAFLDTLAQRLGDAAGGTDKAFAATMFQWPRPGESALLWEAAAARLEAALDAAFPEGRGLVIAVVENFDGLLASLFKDPADEQRLRQWLDRRRNRVMLLATATGTVDIDYERPLFKAFEPVRLLPWSSDDCISYFKKQRERQDKPALTTAQTAKARAIADFIGGTPRLAQLLAEVLDTQEALTVADTMSALADKLAEYYRRRIEDLPPLGRGLLDALIRGGEPASATELAARVNADGQNIIARAMDDLKRADIIRGRAALDGRETLFSVTDRVFVHYYRLRQGSGMALATPLATILDFLKSFYSREEQREQGFGHLVAGRVAEAKLFAQLAQENVPRNAHFYTLDFPNRLNAYLDAAPEGLGVGIADFIKALDDDATKAFDTCLKIPDGSPAVSAVKSVARAQALHRLGFSAQAHAELQNAVAAAGDDATARIIAGLELHNYLVNVLLDESGAYDLACALEVLVSGIQSRRVTLNVLGAKSWSLGALGRHEEAVAVCRQSLPLAEQSGDLVAQARFFRHMAFSLLDLAQYGVAAQAASRAVELARATGSQAAEAISLRHLATALGQLGRHDEALSNAYQAAELAKAVGDKRAESDALYSIMISLLALERFHKLVDVARNATALNHDLGDKTRKSKSRFLLIFAILSIGKYDEAWRTTLAFLNEAMEANDAANSYMGALLALFIATYAPHAEAVALYAACLDAIGGHAFAGEIDVFGLEVGYAFAAAARAVQFDALDRLLEKHGAWLASRTRNFLFESNGSVIARVAEAQGRADAYATAAGLLPRLAVYIGQCQPTEYTKPWLPELISAFAAECRDAGLLRDVATLLTSDLSPDAAETAASLRALADFDEAADPEAKLARMDPDTATLIRRLRNLPDRVSEQPKRRRARKAPGLKA